MIMSFRFVRIDGEGSPGITAAEFFPTLRSKMSHFSGTVTITLTTSSSLRGIEMSPVNSRTLTPNGVSFCENLSTISETRAFMGARYTTLNAGSGGGFGIVFHSLISRHTAKSATLVLPAPVGAHMRKLSLW